MSLDVYLELPEPTVGHTGIFVRENGTVRELTRQEWDERFPDREPIIFCHETGQVFWRNITHNLNKMALAAGIYEALWRPDEHGFTHALHLIPILRKGIERMKAAPDQFTPYNPPNRWGDYDCLLAFAELYLEACEKYPHAKVRASR